MNKVTAIKLLGKRVYNEMSDPSLFYIKTVRSSLLTMCELIGCTEDELFRLYGIGLYLELKEEEKRELV